MFFTDIELSSLINIYNYIISIYTMLVTAYIYIYIYNDHSTNRENFALRVSNRKYCLRLYFFLRKFIVMGLFMHFPVFVILFTDSCFFFTGNSACVLSIDCLFHLSSSWQSHFKTMCKLFLIKHYFFVQITHSSVNFMQLAFFSYQEFDGWPLFKVGAHKTYILLRLKCFLLEANSKECRV